MIMPYVTMLTAGVILVLQMLLAFAVSAARGQNDTWVGDGGSNALLRATRRHANLAENAGIFIAGFLLLELSNVDKHMLMGLCGAFVLARLIHALGLSRPNTNNPLRLVGGVGTYLIGLGLGGLLVWIAATALSATPIAG